MNSKMPMNTSDDTNDNQDQELDELELDELEPQQQEQLLCNLNYHNNRPSITYQNRNYQLFPGTSLNGIQIHHSAQHHVVGAGSQHQLAVQIRRKEKARIAARARRSQEANIIMEMAQELLITQEKIRRIDKATIIRLAIDYIKAFEILCKNSSIAGGRASGGPSNNRICQLQAINYESQSNTNNNNGLSSLSTLTSASTLTSSNSNLAMPKFSTTSVFSSSKKNFKNSNKFLVLKEETSILADNQGGLKESGKLLVFKEDDISDDDDLTHLAPQAGGEIISLNFEESLDGIVLNDPGIFV